MMNIDAIACEEQKVGGRAKMSSAKSRVPLLRPRSHGSATLIFSAFSLLAQNTGSTSKFEIVGLI
jgi:hypothetical protein